MEWYPPEVEDDKLQSKKSAWLRAPAQTFPSLMRKVGNNDCAVMARQIEGPGIYFIGIIDTLQRWNWKKKLERKWKTWILFKDGNGLSCVEPQFYKKRFLRQMIDMGIRPYQQDDQKLQNDLHLHDPGFKTYI